jgi:inner centromere protein
LSLQKTSRVFSTASGTNLTGSASGYKTSAAKTSKKTSASTDSLEETRKVQQAAQLLEEKRKAREEKQKQAQLQREALEKEKREQALKLQLERDEKHKKIMKEKEEKQRMEAMKKKLLKEKQAKKYAEEKMRKDENAFVKPDPPQSANDSLFLKMQKQILMEKEAEKKKLESKKVYDFDMLHTDDSTDDESKPSAKRPAVPSWSKKSSRKPQIVMQSYVNPAVLDSLFSTKPISVDLREIFPAIDARKLVRNSSAVWRTPPKHYPQQF